MTAEEAIAAVPDWPEGVAWEGVLKALHEIEAEAMISANMLECYSAGIRRRKAERQMCQEINFLRGMVRIAAGTARRAYQQGRADLLAEQQPEPLGRCPCGRLLAAECSGCPPRGRRITAGQPHP